MTAYQNRDFRGPNLIAAEPIILSPLPYAVVGGSNLPHPSNCYPRVVVLPPAPQCQKKSQQHYPIGVKGTQKPTSQVQLPSHRAPFPILTGNKLVPGMAYLNQLPLPPQPLVGHQQQQQQQHPAVVGRGGFGSAPGTCQLNVLKPSFQSAAYFHPVGVAASHAAPAAPVDVRQLAVNRLYQILALSPEGVSDAKPAAATAVAALPTQQKRQPPPVMVNPQPTTDFKARGSGGGGIEGEQPQAAPQRRVFCIGSRCGHVEHWKRLRAKQVTAYYICRLCAMKWRITSTSSATDLAVLSLPHGSSVVDVTFTKVDKDRERERLVPPSYKRGAAAAPVPALLDEVDGLSSSEQGGTPQLLLLPPKPNQKPAAVPKKAVPPHYATLGVDIDALLGHLEQLYTQEQQQQPDSDPPSEATPHSESFPFSPDDFLEQLTPPSEGVERGSGSVQVTP